MPRVTAPPEVRNRDSAGDPDISKARPISVRASATAPARAGAPGEPETGPAVIQRHVKSLPAKPGVYRMIDGAGEVLYVGKAKNLKNRVGAYAKLGGHTNRIARMIAQTADMEFVVTGTETEALLLETNLIKKFRPPFNVLMRDDKSFPYILIRRDHEAPQILKHRGARNKKGEYFGPFANAGAVERTLNTLQKAFLIRSCADSVYANRSRPCMLHQIKRCAAPCVGLVSTEEHAKLVGEAVAFLSGKSENVREQLAAEMEAAAENLEFERAARLRDRIRALAAIRASQTINPGAVESADVFAIHLEGGQACIQAFFFRAGQNWGNKAYFPRHDKDMGAAEILAAFIAQFYDDRPIAPLILVSEDLPERALLEAAFSMRASRKVEALTPKRGEKKALVDHALANAAEAHARKLAETASQAALLEGLARVFDLSAPPRRIEVYDNSHIQGANAVGAMIVAGPEGFEKKHYRTFNIKDLETEPGDDYAMMREVFRRRFGRLIKDSAAKTASPKAEGEWPDLVLIDGGEGQLEAARATLAELGLGAGDIALIGVSKGPDRNAGREHFHRPGRPPFMLPENDPVLFFIQRLRDEAHRFAIGTHRARRAKEAKANPLDEIEGVGPARKKALLHRFGSARSVARAALSDLEQTQGVSKELARRIFDHFRGAPKPD